MKLFRSSQPAALELAAPGQEVRVFPSETAEILGSPELIQARIMLLMPVGMFASLLLISVCMRVDRVISSESGQIVTVEPPVVLSALDTDWTGGDFTLINENRWGSYIFGTAVLQLGNS